MVYARFAFSSAKFSIYWWIFNYQDDDYDTLEDVEPFTEVVEEFIDEANEAVYQEFPQDHSVFDSDKNKF